MALSIKVILEEHNFWNGKKGIKGWKVQKKVVVFVEKQVEKDLLEEVGEKLDGAEYLELKMRFEAKKMKEGRDARNLFYSP